jgi:hypothetical protein
MKILSGIIAQAYPAAGVLDEIYCTPENSLIQIYSIIVTNHGVGPSKVRISLVSEDAPDDPKQYVVFDKSIPANDFALIPISVYFRYEDMIRASSDTGTVSFNVLGTVTEGY